MQFDYFYGAQADMMTFYRIPKPLFTDEHFKGLSSDAKILYGLMLDRMSLSIKNKWFDEQNRAYIYFSIEDIQSYLNCGKNKAVNIMKELDAETGIGLIEKKVQGLGKPAMIYVKNFVIEEAVSNEPEVDSKKEAAKGDENAQTFVNENAKQRRENPEVYISNFKEFKNQTSGGLENKLQEVYKPNPNKNNINNTEYSYNKSNLIISSAMSEKQTEIDAMDEMRAYSELIKENIDYDGLLERYPFEKELIEGIYDLILETVLTRSEDIVIASNRYSTSLVKSKFLKLNYSHIEYVISCFKANTSEIRNIKKYLLAALFNAPSTISGYYTAAVAHDFPQYAKV